jgi:hypothetical protein
VPELARFSFDNNELTSHKRVKKGRLFLFEIISFTLFFLRMKTFFYTDLLQRLSSFLGISEYLTAQTPNNSMATGNLLESNDLLHIQLVMMPLMLDLR